MRRRRFVQVVDDLLALEGAGLDYVLEEDKMLDHNENVLLTQFAKEKGYGYESEARCSRGCLKNKYGMVLRQSQRVLFRP